MTSMRTSAAGRKAIAQREGNKLTAYLDSVGIWTIGVGHTTAAGPPTVKKGMKITAAQSAEILARDLADVENDINSLVKVPLNQNQFDALVSLVFNIGGAAFRKSSLLKRLNGGDYSAASGQFLVWNKGTVNGKKVALKGLTTRRQAEKAQFLAGVSVTSPAPATPKPAPSAFKTDTVTVEIVQRKLYELGYTEVGSRRADGSFDGKLGDMTRAAILIFRADNNLPAVDVIDQQLLTAIDSAPKRTLARNDASSTEVRQSVPEVQSNWLMKVGAFLLGIPAMIGAMFDGILSNIGVARGYIDPLKASFDDIPSWVWLFLIAAVAGGTFLIARRGEKAGVAAYQAGERR